MEKQDYILMKHKEQVAAQKEQSDQQEQTLEELILKIEDVEMLIVEVSDVAYNKAVEVVTDKVREETQKEDLTLISDYKKMGDFFGTKYSKRQERVCREVSGCGPK